MLRGLLTSRDSIMVVCVCFCLHACWGSMGAGWAGGVILADTSQSPAGQPALIKPPERVWQSMHQAIKIMA